jgi:hypothetical protein
LDSETIEQLTRETTEQHLSLSATGWVNQAGKFEIDAITVGEGRGWMFSEAILKESVPLWDGVECFVDHGGWFGGRSVRDLGGVFRSPRWSEETQGVRLDLETMGPSGPLVEELGRQMLQESNVKPKIGFSADVLFTAKGRDVQKILRVISLDLVFNPARGGAFVRALNSLESLALTQDQASNLPAFQSSNLQQPTHNGGVHMSDKENAVPATHTDPPSGSGGTETQTMGHIATQLQRDVESVRQFLEVQEEKQKLADEAEAARKVRLQMCQFLLEAGVGAAKLPAPMAEHVKKQFQNKVFDPADLTIALDEARGLVSDLTGGATVFGPGGRVHAMFTTEDQIQAAVDDLLGAPRSPGHESLQVNKLSGIKELYMMMTGDRNLYGGYYPDRVQLATTANFAGLVKNALNKIVANQWDLIGAAGYDWWMRITTQEHFETLNTVTGTLVGTVGALPTVAEGAEYTELKVGDSPETADFTKYGGYVPLTLELIDRDNTRKLAQYPRELAKAGMRKISALVAGVFTENAGIGPTMADTGALFNATAVTTAGGHANLLTTALSTTEWETVCNAVYSQPLLIANETGHYGTGPAMAIDPRYLLVPRELRLTAMKILYPEWENTANIHSENLQRGEMGDVVVVPEWTDATDWAAVCDPRLAPGIVVCERFGLMPEIFIAGDELSPAVFMNDEHRVKVRHFLAVLVQDFRPLHKSNVA